MLITREREKLLNAIIYFTENVRHAGKTKLFKLLNYLDFLHYEKTGRSVTGLLYYAWKQGPVPKELFEELNHPKKDFIEHLAKSKRSLWGGKVRHELKPRKEFDDKYFSPFELSIMECLAKKHFNDTADDISEASHFETGPWHEVFEVQQNEAGLIPYELVLERRGSEKDMENLELANEYQALVSHFQ